MIRVPTLANGTDRTHGALRAALKLREAIERHSAPATIARYRTEEADAMRALTPIEFRRVRETLDRR